MQGIEIRTHRERRIPTIAVRALYDHVCWKRPGSEADVEAVLEAGPAVGAWDGDELAGFARALTDGHFAAYVEDVMVREDHRKSGVGSEIISRLLEEMGNVAVINLFCELPVAKFYESLGFRQTCYALMQRKKES